MKKVLLILTVAAIGLMLLAGCGGAGEIKRAEPDEGAELVEVTGECTAILNGSVLSVTGETNLMDGTNGIISVFNSDGTKAAEQKFTKQGSKLAADFTVEQDWADVVYGIIMFDTQKSDGQPKEVREVYGKKFQNLTGDPLIWDKNGNIVIFQSEEVVLH